MLKKIVVLILFYFTLNSSYAQVYEVTYHSYSGVYITNANGASGTLKEMLDAAQDYANSTGGIAEVLFNLSGNGMVDVPNGVSSGNSFHTLNLIDGEVQIKKHNSKLNLAQGIVNNVNTNNSITIVLKASALDAKLSIDGLDFNGVALVLDSDKPETIQSNCDIQISNCHFSGGGLGVFLINLWGDNTHRFNAFDKVSITNNTFTKNHAISINYHRPANNYDNPVSYSNEDILIHNNTFLGASHSLVGSYAIASKIYVGGCDFGTVCPNQHLRLFGGKISITNNILSKYNEGITLLGVNDFWTIENNSINDCSIGLYAKNGAGTNNKINLIESNSNAIGFGSQNQLNEFTNCITSIRSLLERTILVGEINGTGIGGQVKLENYGVVSNCLIQNTPLYQANNSGTFKPIDLLGNPFPMITINAATVIGNSIDVDYTVDLNSSFLNGNKDYRLEYFLANDLGSLTQVLGSQVLTNPQSTANTYVHTLSNINGVAHKLGVTVTSFDPSSPEDGVTSEVFFFDLVCEGCNSFSPSAGEQYWLTGWVNVEYPEETITYKRSTAAESPSIELEMVGLNTSVVFYPTGEIIDGWQRVVGSFIVPQGADAFSIQLNADMMYNTYFDDIRVHPFNGSMKSYVYDPETYFLTAELDDNNYATFYEYDNEGGLIRIKKETARGIVTIQETRSNTVKN